MSKAAARVASQVGTAHADGLVRMSEIAWELAAHSSTSDEDAALLFKLAPNYGRRTTSVRYFVRSARALGLLEFEDDPDSLDVIGHPRLPDATPARPVDTGIDEVGEPRNF